MSVILLEYQFSDQVTVPPTGSQIRLNAAFPYTAVTACHVRDLTTDGADMRELWLALATGSGVYLQDKNDHLKFVRVRTTGPAVEAVEYVTVSVEHLEHGELVPNQACLCLLSAPGTGAALTPGPAWISLADAKAHLKIPADDTRDDAELERVVLEASDVIKTYLGARALPAWETTAPPPRIQSGVKLMLGYLWTARDDQAEAATTWTAITNLLERDRDPALA